MNSEGTSGVWPCGAGLPAVTLPVCTVGGRPLGLSLVSARGTDEALLHLACRLEAALVGAPPPPPGR